jgi:RsiW-degrading membrane proteinase PrsW (M82 family)
LEANPTSKNHVTIQIHKPSKNELLFFLLSGAVVSVPLTLFIEQFANPFLVGLSEVDIALLTIAIFAPFIEEFSKIFPLFYRHGETQRSIFNLALFVGLGFGIVEFFTYVLTVGPQIIPDRIPGLIFHPASTSISAFGIATKKPLPYYLAAVSLHFANNILAVTVPRPFPASFIILVIAMLVSWRLYEKTKDKFIESDYAVIHVGDLASQ